MFHNWAVVVVDVSMIKSAMENIGSSSRLSYFIRSSIGPSTLPASGCLRRVSWNRLMSTEVDASTRMTRQCTSGLNAAMASRSDWKFCTVRTSAPMATLSIPPSWPRQSSANLGMRSGGMLSTQ